MGPTLPFKHYRMATLIVLDMRSATTTSHRADFTRTMSVAIAISFRYAWARAGASFTPFPTIATQRGPPLRGNRAAFKPLALGIIDPSRSKLTVAATSDLAQCRPCRHCKSCSFAVAREHHHLFAQVLQFFEWWTWPLALLAAIASINKKLSFPATHTTTCLLLQIALPVVAFTGLRRAQHTALTLRSQVMWCSLEPPPPTPGQKLSGTPPHRSAWSQSRWTRDIFVQDAICQLHKPYGQGAFASSLC